MNDLIPQPVIPSPDRQPRQMKQPRKDELRELLAHAEAKIAHQRIVIEQLRTPWWRRLYQSVRRTPKDAM